MSYAPDNFTGVTVTANNVANTWGVDTEIRAGASATVPFRVVGYHFNPDISQKYRVRFSGDSGVTFFDDVLVETAKQVGSTAPSGTEFIFNAGARINASAKAQTGGEDTILVWVKIQEIGDPIIPAP